jgi:1-acyl-sn-glycerol-3-phosphate acyltransferase
MTPIARVVQLGGIIVLRPWWRLAFQVRVHRAGPRPVGPVLYAANHRSFADPPLATVWSPVPCAFFARASLWKIPPIKLFLDIFGGIPVERENPGASSMKGAVARLRDGWPVLVFPEGTRTKTGTLGRLREGPALFARRAGVPVVPVYLHRSESIWPRGWILPALWGARVEVWFGKPLVPPPGLAPRDADAWITRRLDRWMHRQEARLARR